MIATAIFFPPRTCAIINPFLFHSFGRNKSGMGLPEAWQSDGWHQMQPFLKRQRVRGANTHKRQLEQQCQQRVYSFKYAEDLQAAYLKYDLSGKKWNLTAGLRGEYNYAKADGYDFSYRHFDLFPSLYYTYRLSKWHTMIFSASRRTQRVGFIRLMPYRYYHSRYTLNMGNPNLRPDYSNHISVTYQLAQKYNLTLTHVWSNNGLDNYNRTETVGGQAMTVASYVDGVKNRLTNLNLYVPINVASWWSIVNQARVSFDKYITSETSVNNFDWKIYTQHTFVLPLDIRMQLLYRYISESKSAYGKSRDYHQLDFSCMKTLFNDKLTCKLSVNDLICGQKNWSYTLTNKIYRKTYMYGRFIPLFRLLHLLYLYKGKTETARFHRAERQR
ncbi:MAG: outer membrane beta-barrel family protein [Hoylesella buccalis]